MSSEVGTASVHGWDCVEDDLRSYILNIPIAIRDLMRICLGLSAATDSIV